MPQQYAALNLDSPAVLRMLVARMLASGEALAKVPGEARTVMRVTVDDWLAAELTKDAAFPARDGGAPSSAVPADA